MKALFTNTDLRILKNHQDKVNSNIILAEIKKLIQNKRNKNYYRELIYERYGFEKVIVEDPTY